MTVSLLILAAIALDFALSCLIGACIHWGMR